jgi:hypothetical protein
VRGNGRTHSFTLTRYEDAADIPIVTLVVAVFDIVPGAGPRTTGSLASVVACALWPRGARVSTELNAPHSGSGGVAVMLEHFAQVPTSIDTGVFARDVTAV